jgi:hypothetical protein
MPYKTLSRGVFTALSAHITTGMDSMGFSGKSFLR